MSYILFLIKKLNFKLNSNDKFKFIKTKTKIQH